jgi:sugar/nucleoside kinase (ribokinase family)
MKNKIKRRVNKKPICIGAGLVALDVILNGDPKTPPKIFAGGSCGNVLTILSFLEWRTYPIARLANNPASKELVDDLKSWKVNTLLVSRTSDGSTPIIIERIKKDKQGNPIHRFEFRNPEDGEYLPGYKPVLSKEVENLVKVSPVPKTFYFDRVNRASIELAKTYKDLGSFIFFEPSSISEPRLFEECLNICDVIKFSSDRIPNYSELYPKQRVPLEIETAGKDGLRYRYGKSLSSLKWTHLKPYKIGGFVDGAGAGDWCSAGVISRIGTSGSHVFRNLRKKKIEEALLFGQALGAVNCCFDGARGIMYNLSKSTIDDIVKRIKKHKDFSMAILDTRKIKKRATAFKISSLI